MPSKGDARSCGFFLPLAFGYLDASTGRPESCFWVMLGLVLTSLVWLHLVVVDLKRRALRPARQARPIDVSTSADAA